MPNCIIVWQFCAVHLCALVQSEPVQHFDLASPLFSLCKLLRHQEYAASWKAAISLAVSRRLHVVPCSSEDLHSTVGCEVC